MRVVTIFTGVKVVRMGNVFDFKGLAKMGFGKPVVFVICLSVSGVSYLILSLIANHATGVYKQLCRFVAPVI